MGQNQLLDEFLLESFENLSTFRDELKDIERSFDQEKVNSLYRTIHTLKGSASFLGMQGLQAFAHTAESVLDLLRDQRIKCDPQLIDVFFQVSDVLQDTLKYIEAEGGEPDAVNDRGVGRLLFQILEKSAGITPPPEESVAESSASMVVKESIPARSQEQANPVFKTPKNSGDTPKEEAVTPLNVPDNGPDQLSSAPTSEPSQVSTKASIADSIVRVNVKLLDKIMNVVGELVLNRNQIVQFAGREDNPEYLKLAQQLDAITTELQTDILSTRMQPIGNILGKYERLVRDFSRESGKKIQLSISGQETELDKTLLDAIKDPLTHIVRNCADHGIEDPDERKKVGKTVEGMLAVRAYHESGQVTVEIADDGRGINPDKVLAKAISKGILTEEKGQSLSDEEIFGLVFSPGFSTAEQVTNISGRGVGMDVVKTNIEKIGGSVQLTSKFGEGTKIKLRIPLTLAITPALIVRSLETKFAIPQVNLVELVQVDQSDLGGKVQMIENSEFIRLREQLIPIFHLGNVLQLDRENPDCYNIVILNAEGHIYGVVVDEILDTEEIVVKPLGHGLKYLGIYAGATIRGDGRASLIIDPLGFFSHVNDHKEIIEQRQTKEETAKGTDTDLLESIIFTLGDDQKYAIPLGLVGRLEEFARKDIEKVGDRFVVRYFGRAMPLVNVEQALGLDATSIIHGDSSNVPCIVVAIDGAHTGFAVQEIHDISQSFEAIDSKSVHRDVFLGTIYVNDQIITVLNTHEVVSPSPSISREVGQLEPLRILLVEDSSMYRTLGTKTLESEGHSVSCARNGEEAIELLNSGQEFDLIITDVEMPSMDGFTLAEKISSHERWSSIPVVGLTTRVSEEDRARGIESGFKEHLSKFKKDDVIRCVRQFQNSKRHVA